MRSLLIVLTIALISLLSGPARAQTAADDQYGSSGVGYDAATDALRASRVFDDAPDAEAAISEEEGTALAAEEGVAVAAEATTASSDLGAASAEESTETEAADSEGVAAIDSLPDTGGISVVLLGVLLAAGGVLIRTLAR